MHRDKCKIVRCSLTIVVQRNLSIKVRFISCGCVYQLLFYFYELGFVNCSLVVLTLSGFINSYFLSSLWIFQTTQMPNLHLSPYISPSLQSWFLEVNTLKTPDMGCVSAVFKACGPTSRQRRPVRLHSTHERLLSMVFHLPLIGAMVPLRK